MPGPYTRYPRYMDHPDGPNRGQRPQGGNGPANSDAEQKDVRIRGGGILGNTLRGPSVTLLLLIF